MERLGTLLRSIRTEWGLSLREVKDRSELLAKRWGNPRYASSFSHPAKLELGQHECGDIDELARGNDLGRFPIRWKVLLVPVIR